MKLEVLFPDNNPHFNFELPDVNGDLEVYYTYKESPTFYYNKPLVPYWGALRNNTDNLGKVKKVIFHYEEIKIIKDFNPIKVKWLRGYKELPTPYYPLKCPGVTTVLDLIPDPDWERFKEEVGEEKAKEIQEAAWHRGTAMHTFIENFINELAESKDPSKALQHTFKVSLPILESEGVPMEKIDKGREMFDNFYHSEYANSYMDLIGTEIPLYSPILYYRGKADVFYKERGFGRVVTDFKTTSKRIEKGTVKELKYKRQLGGYALAVEHMFAEQGVKINKASILAVHTKSALIQEIICQGDELEEQKEEFKTLVKEWHRINNQAFLFDE